MGEDKEISRQVWDGRIPICFTLAEDEHTPGQDPPPPYYVLAPRISYLTLVTDACQRHFLNSKREPPNFDDEFWCDLNGMPLKWNYPIGVLFDLYGSPDMLPWNITVHFQVYPEDDILHCAEKSVVEEHMLSCLKEADCIRNGSAKRTLNLLKKDVKQLWDGFRSGNYERYWQINKRLAPHDGESAKNIPFRIYRRQGGVVMGPFNPINEQGEFQTLGDLLSTCLPDLYPPATSYASETDNLQHSLKPTPIVIIQGVQPSLETPVQWLSDSCSHPDNFLHIVIRMSDEEVEIADDSVQPPM
ncbi:hypothetical protein SARC_10845 [Sphaeroforma arctica JP610]|uniref:Autophagy protein 5 n=1 Tax=Sphaeroforma arctica JP610 TaxID=667725 RepID=A0A0L0FIR2_9EUKA|nr:hypothetical protein SARC_10845 [Sphaeroforma arctica JP610]KNC76667.1 hypothetical protein SARC_10845 [Sphaeroforma arctica JP610]|eukprot:XP_014150569.1 hypothetical protein SARC_10845 [Sphaeroforma arctica JP610]